MKMNLEALKALEAKLAEYKSVNGPVAEHMSQNTNTCDSCYTGSTCKGTCRGTCIGSCNGR